MAGRPETTQQTATAKVWSRGRTWQVHAKHPDTGAWIRRTGFKTEIEANWAADGMIARLDAEARLV